MNKFSPPTDPIPVEELASQAMSLVLTDRGEARAQTYLDMIHHLAMAFIDDDPDVRRKAISDAMTSGASGQEFIDLFASDTARYLGDLWSRNEISFVDVTIGAARIQESVRTISARRNQGQARSSAPSILLAVPEIENHMLAAFLAGEGFRSFGCNVNMVFGRSDREVAAEATIDAYEMIGVSISSNRTIRAAADLIKAIRGVLRTNVPIVVGGSRINAENLRRETGADYAISDVRQAMTVCNIAMGEFQEVQEKHEPLGGNE